jgi:hypothetical protein
MTRSRGMGGLVAGVLLGCAAAPSSATVLTFDLFTDPGKTTYVANGTTIPGGYGDNVIDFDPAGPVGGTYVRYGSGGGFTPDVTLDYHWITKANHAEHFAPEFQTWHPQYGDLDHVVYRYNGSMATWAGIMIFTPAAGYQVTLETFDIAGYVADRGGYDYAVIQDVGLPGESTLWTNASTAPGTGHLTLSPSVTVQGGHTLSLYFNADGNLGIDNVRFTQSLIPEPASAALLLAGAGLLLRRTR